MNHQDNRNHPSYAIVKAVTTEIVNFLCTKKEIETNNMLRFDSRSTTRRSDRSGIREKYKGSLLVLIPILKLHRKDDN